MYFFPNSKFKVFLVFLFIFGTSKIQPVGNIPKCIKENKGVFGIISAVVGASGLSFFIGKYYSSSKLAKTLEELKNQISETRNELGTKIENQKDELNKTKKELKGQQKELEKQKDEIGEWAKKYVELQSKYTDLLEKNKKNQDEKERFCVNYDSAKFEMERRLQMSLQRTRNLEETYNEPHVEI